MIVAAADSGVGDEAAVAGSAAVGTAARTVVCDGVGTVDARPASVELRGEQLGDDCDIGDEECSEGVTATGEPGLA